MLFGTGHQIEEIEDTLKTLIQNQEDAVDNLQAEIKKNETEEAEQIRLAQKYVREMVILGDDENYAKLGRTIREAGATYNFPELIAQWREQDKKNREDKQALINTHGSQSDVRARMAALEAEMSVISEALGDMRPEIEAFDEATGKIAAHNEKFPSLTISEGMHDDYENFSFWRWLGYYTFIHRAPHSAYLAIGDYTAQYGDYYEDARDIAKLRRNEQEQDRVLAELTSKRDAEKAIDSQMSHLDRSFRGPEGIGREIRQRIFDFMRTDDDYADILFDRSNFSAARNAALSLAKAEALKSLRATLEPFVRNAKETLEDLKSPMNKFSFLPYEVENTRISYDLDGLVRSVTRAEDETGEVLKNAQEARSAMVGLEPRAHESYADVRRALEKEIDLKYHDNHLSINFIDLSRLIERAKDDYEAEQRAKRAAEEAARAARRELLSDSFETAARQRQRRESRIGSPAPRTRMTSINRPSSSRTRTKTTSVSRGTKGLSGSRGRSR